MEKNGSSRRSPDEGSEAPQEPGSTNGELLLRGPDVSLQVGGFFDLCYLLSKRGVCRFPANGPWLCLHLCRAPRLGRSFREASSSLEPPRG